MKIAKVTPKGTYIIDYETGCISIVKSGQHIPSGIEMDYVWFDESATVDPLIWEKLNQK